MPTVWPGPADATTRAAGLRAGWRPLRHRNWPWLAAAALLALVGASAILRWDIAARREAFAVDARIAHRVLSQRAAQLDAVLATLALLAPGADADDAAMRLPALWPAVLAVQRSDAQHPWPDAELAVAERQSRALPAPQRRAVATALDPARGHYALVLAGTPASWALQVDARRLVADEEWPLSDTGPVRAWLVAGARHLVLHEGAPASQQPSGLTTGFTFSKALATPSQPFDLRLQRATGPAQWPWGWLIAWTATCVLAVGTLRFVLRTRATQRRQAELVRLAQAARLNSLGELAAGMAHELNQPLAAVLASTQAARRLLQPQEQPDEPPQSPGPGHDSADDGPDLPAARQALGLAVAQARRASDVLARLRRLVQGSTQGAVAQRVDLHALCLRVLQLVDAELQQRGIRASVSGSVPVLEADPVALEQIVHNLVTNATQALERAAARSPQIALELRSLPDRPQVQLTVRDNGPGFAPEALARAFEPFFTTRTGGLGLGLPLCETLAQALGGSLQARNLGPAADGSTGAELVLTLPLAGPASPLPAARGPEATSP